MTLPKAKLSADAPAPTPLTAEDHARIDEESSRVVKELDDRFRKVETLPIELVVMKPFRRLTDEEAEKAREEMKVWGQTVGQRFEDIETLPLEKLRQRVR